MSPMPTPTEWKPIEPNLERILAQCAAPLENLARGEVPAVILRNAYPEPACQQLVERCIAEQLLYDPAQPVPDKLLEQAIPEGFYKEGRSKEAKRAWSSTADAAKRRIDIGTSLGYRGAEREDFFSHSHQTHELFGRLFKGFASPVEVVYRNLTELSGGKRAVTAHEPDGRQYGPAIIRAHYGAYTYKPHFDSVRLREKREDYAVHAFEHQFAGVLVLQNAERDGETAQSTIHRYLWQPEVQPHLENGTFHDYAKERGIESCRVSLNPGDLYFFNTRSIHEVPGLEGVNPRVVLATFIGYSSDRDEMFVWS